MTTERAPVHEEPLIKDQPSTTPWSLAQNAWQTQSQAGRAGSPPSDPMAART